MNFTKRVHDHHVIMEPIARLQLFIKQSKLNKLNLRLINDQMFANIARMLFRPLTTLIHRVS